MYERKGGRWRMRVFDIGALAGLASYGMLEVKSCSAPELRLQNRAKEQAARNGGTLDHAKNPCISECPAAAR